MPLCRIRKKYISECVNTAKKTLKVLRSNKRDSNFELFYQRRLKRAGMHACLRPPTLTRRRNHRNYQEMQNHFIVDGYEDDNENL